MRDESTREMIYLRYIGFRRKRTNQPSLALPGLEGPRVYKDLEEDALIMECGTKSVWTSHSPCPRSLSRFVLPESWSATAMEAWAARVCEGAQGDRTATPENMLFGCGWIEM